MKFFVDTGNLSDISRITENYPIIGVTTNPTLLAREKNPDPAEHLLAIRRIIGPDRQLHVQLTETDATAMISEAEAIVSLLGKNTFLKIPVGAVGLTVTRTLSQRGFGVTETAIFSAGQALLAAQAGAAYVAPYVNRLDNILGDGVSVVSDIAQIFDCYGLETQILAASFKSIQQVVNVALAGGHTATINPDLFDQLAAHPLTDVAVSGFSGDWKAVYGEKKLADFVKEKL